MHIRGHSHCFILSYNRIVFRLKVTPHLPDLLKRNDIIDHCKP